MNKNPILALIQLIKAFLAWTGSFFLWFISPTVASELWEKWLKKKEERGDDDRPS